MPWLMTGSWADETLTDCFFNHIRKQIGEYKICVVQGFPWAGAATGILVGPIPKRSTHQLHQSVYYHLIHLSDVYTSLWQASEWERHGLQGSFPCCKNGMPLDKDKRQMVSMFIHNFCTEIVGHNQISEVFSLEYERAINIHWYNQIQRYYLQPGDYETNNQAKLFQENFGGESNSK